MLAKGRDDWMDCELVKYLFIVIVGHFFLFFPAWLFAYLGQFCRPPLAFFYSSAQSFFGPKITPQKRVPPPGQRLETWAST